MVRTFKSFTLNIYTWHKRFMEQEKYKDAT